MRCNAKAKGSRRERQARKILETAGYHVTRAGGSLGVFDLIALGPAGARLIQVKSNERPRPAERERLELFPRLPYCSKELWIFHDRAREPTIEVLT
jgi:Holliday junction resolvase